MASQEIELKIIIDAENKVSAVIGDVEKQIGGLKSKVADLGPAFTTMAVAGGAALAGIVAFGKASIESAMESEKLTTQLDAVIKSTQGAAGVTADMATKIATSFQKITKFSDEDVLSVENLMLTFTKVNKDIFPQAIGLALDMSTALGQDLKSSSIQLGKALQDPILGVTALRRVGVNFTKDQQEVIKGLVETGHAAEAQAMIMKELATEFGGSATAAGKTFGGQMAILNNQIDDVKENIGRSLIPVIQKVVTAVKPVVEKLLAWTEANPELTTKIFLVGGAISFLVLTLGTLGLVIPKVIIAVKSFAALFSIVGKAFMSSITFLFTNPIGWVILAIAALVVAGYLIYKHWDAIKSKAQEVWSAVFGFIKENIDKILVFLGPAGWLVLAIKTIIKHWDDIKIATSAAWNAIANTITTVWNNIAAFFGAVWETIKSIFKFAVDFIIGLVVLGFRAMGIDIVQMVKDMGMGIQMAWEWIKTAWGVTINFIIGVMTALGQQISNIWNAIKGTWTAATTAISDTTKAIWAPIGAYLTARMNEIKAVITIAWEAIKTVWKMATDWVKTTTQNWGQTIKDIIMSVVNFITDKFKWITDKFNTIKNAAGSVLDKVGGAIGGAVSKVVGVGKSITGFAEGGIVPGPRGAPMMAMVHGGERVLTADEAERGGQTLIFNFNEVVAGEDGIRRIITQTIQTLNRQTTLRTVAGQ